MPSAQVVTEGFLLHALGFYFICREIQTAKHQLCYPDNPKWCLKPPPFFFPDIAVTGGGGWGGGGVVQ